MIIVWFFDLGPVLFGFLILIMGLAGKLMEALPVIETIYWILFAILCIGAMWMVITDGYPSLAHRLAFGAVLAGCLLFMGILSSQFFASMVTAYGDGGLNGFFELLFAVFGGVFIWLIGFMAATYVSILLPMDKNGDITGGRLTMATICTIGLLCLVLL